MAYRDPKHGFLVKRLVGKGGDRIHLNRKVLYLNGMSRDETYAIHSPGLSDRYRDNFPWAIESSIAAGDAGSLHAQVRDGDFIVPAGTLFYVWR